MKEPSSLVEDKVPHQMPEVDRLLEQIRERVRHVEGMRRRGASSRELEAHRSEIGRLRWRLANLVSSGHTD